MFCSHLLGSRVQGSFAAKFAKEKDSTRIKLHAVECSYSGRNALAESQLEHGYAHGISV